MISNLLPNQGIKAANAKLMKTTAASLIMSDFDTNIEEELIEESLSPAILADARQTTQRNESVVSKDDNLAEDKQNNNNSIISFNESSDTILKPNEFENYVSSGTSTKPIRTESINYSVQLGDTVSSIARNFGLNINTVLWANNLSNYSLIRPGDELLILPSNGLLYTVKSGDNLSKIASTYKIEVTDIMSNNNLSDTVSLKIGEKLLLPGATKIATVYKPAPVTSNPSYTAVSAIKDIVKAPAAQASGDNMVWPTDGKRITQYFSFRHNGLDIGNKIGTPIYAADAGTIELANTGWNGGYGNTILINHGGGKKTRYGHLTKLYVKAGDTVEKGENIGTMGSTGNSTGPHLHFEVIINGTRYNPLNYIK